MANKNEFKHKINNQIRFPEVRIVGEFDRTGDIVSSDEARKIAYDLDLDLVLINPKGVPPVCKIIDYSKFVYDLKKKKKEQEKKQKDNKVEVKELRFGPNTDEHDYNFKLNHAISFLEKGNILKAYVFFKGREIHYKDKGKILLLKLATDLEDVGIPTNVDPKLEGKKMIMMFKPSKKKNKNG